MNKQFDVHELFSFLWRLICLKFRFGPKCDVRNCSKFGPVVMWSLVAIVNCYATTQQECQNVCNTLNHLQGKRNGLFGLQLLVPPPPIGPQGHLVTEFCGKEGRIRHVFRNTSTTAILHVIIMMPPHLTSSCSQLGSAVAAIFGAFYSSWWLGARRCCWFIHLTSVFEIWQILLCGM